MELLSVSPCVRNPFRVALIHFLGLNYWWEDDVTVQDECRYHLQWFINRLCIKFNSPVKMEGTKVRQGDGRGPEDSSSSVLPLPKGCTLSWGRICPSRGGVTHLKDGGRTGQGQPRTSVAWPLASLADCCEPASGTGCWDLPATEPHHTLQPG